jgi:WD40 repeat protein
MFRRGRVHRGRFDAFISYSHARSATIATAVQTGLHRFARPWYRARALRVFRDTTNLSVSPHLWSDIVEALSSSAWLVLIASPEAATSRWVAREMAWWLANRSAERLLIVVTDGRLAWDDERHGLDPARTTAVPAILADAFAEEPLWADLSGSGEGDEPYSEAKMRDAVAALSARIHGRPLDEMVGAHLQEQRRTRRVVVSVIAVLTALVAATTTASTVALAQRDEAVRQRDAAGSRSLILAADSLRDARRGMSLLAGAAAMRLNPSAQARASLVTTLVGNQYEGTLAGTDGSVLSARFDPTGRTAVIGYADGAAALWDVSVPAHPRILAVLPGGGGGCVVAIRPDGGVVATGYLDGGIVLWDVRDPAHPRRMGEANDGATTTVLALAFSPDGRTLVTSRGQRSSSSGSKVTVWDTTDPAKPRATRQQPTFDVPLAVDISFHPDGRTVALATVDGVQLWDVGPGAAPRRLATLRTNAGAVSAVAFSPSGTTLVGGADSLALVWDTTHPARPQQIAVITDFAADSVRAVAYSPDRTTVAFGTRDGVATLWNLAVPAQPALIARLTGHDGPVDTLAFSPDARTVLTGGSDGTAQLWHSRDPTAPQRLSATRAATEPITFVGTGSGEQSLITAATDAPAQPTAVSLWAWDGLAEPRATGHFYVFDGAATAVGGDGRQLAFATGEAVVLWRVAPEPIPRQTGVINERHVNAISWFPNGARLVSASTDDGRPGRRYPIIIWDVADPGRPRLVATVTGLQDAPVSHVAISHDGTILAADAGDLGNEAIELIDVSRPATPRLTGSIRIGATSALVSTIAFDPGRNLLAIGTDDSTVQLWDVGRASQPREVAVLGATAAVRELIFSRDGDLVAAVTDAGTVDVWDVAEATTPLRLTTITTATSARITSAAFSPDAHRLMLGGDDGNLTEWSIEQLAGIARDPLGYACGITGRGLSPGEWRQLAPSVPYRSTC